MEAPQRVTCCGGCAYDQTRIVHMITHALCVSRSTHNRWHRVQHVFIIQCNLDLHPHSILTSITSFIRCANVFKCADMFRCADMCRCADERRGGPLCRLRRYTLSSRAPRAQLKQVKGWSPCACRWGTRVCLVARMDATSRPPMGMRYGGPLASMPSPGLASTRTVWLTVLNGRRRMSSWKV